MAENLDSNYSEDVSEGHLTSFKFPVCPYPIIKASEYQHIYHTHCKSLPTSWKFDVKLEEGSSNFCLMSISRSDSIDKPVDAYVWLQGFDIFEEPLYYRITFFKAGIHPFVAEEEYIQKLAPDEKLRNLPHKFLFVKVFILIVSCHQKIVPSKESEAATSEEHNVKKMAENLDSKNSEEVPEEYNVEETDESLCSNYSEDVLEGHLTSFKFPVWPYPIIKASEYQHIYHTHCKSLPTSWKFDVKFEEGSSNFCLMSISRSDSIDKPVDAYVWLQGFDIFEKPLYYRITFFKEGILPFVAEKEYIQKLAPDEKLGNLPNKCLFVKVFILIVSCHQKIVPSKESEAATSEEHNVEKMAENLNSNSPEQVTEGHYTSFKFSVCPYPNIKASGYRHNYHTLCKSLPTSWWFNVNFEARSLNSCLVYFSRNDSTLKAVCDIHVWLSCFDINNRLLCSPRINFSGGILPLVSKAQFIRELIPFEELGILPQQTLVVKVFALITSCHQKIVPSKEQEAARSEEPNVEKMAENLD